MSRENSNLPIPVKIANANNASQVQVATAVFFRTESNSNIEIVIPMGLSTGGVAGSPAVYLPSVLSTFQNSNNVSFSDGNRANILQNTKILHNVTILFKLTKSDGTNFRNLREVRCYLVRADGSKYDNSIYSYNQPSTGTHDTMTLRGYIQHTAGSQVLLQFFIAQNDFNGDQSDTQITIFRINWDLTAITDG